MLEMKPHSPNGHDDPDAPDGSCHVTAHNVRRISVRARLAIRLAEAHVFHPGGGKKVLVGE